MGKTMLLEVSMVVILDWGKLLEGTRWSFTGSGGIHVLLVIKGTSYTGVFRHMGRDGRWMVGR